MRVGKFWQGKSLVKILINAASANLGGAVTYITNLLRELPAVASNDRFIVVVPPDTLKLLEDVVDERIVELHSVPRKIGGTLRRLAFDNFTIPRLARERGADVLFSSTGFATLFSPCPQVLLVRNTAYFCPHYQRKYKEIGKSFHSKRLRRWWSLLSIRAADTILFPSDAMRKLVELHTALSGKRTEVLRYGFKPETFFRDDAVKLKITGHMEKWKKEGYLILLTVSSFSIQKNLTTLIEALPALSSWGIKFKLVTTISREVTSDKQEFDCLMQRIRALGLSDNVVSAGHLKYEQLHYLYQKSDAFIFPSFTESFGHPLVEAMACGLPIVASDIPANRELCGDTAIYFDAFSSKHCAKRLIEILENIDHDKIVKERLLSRSRIFSWELYAEVLLKVFKDTCGGQLNATD
jgi:glycosyltransferase involved in cell wall biosynthesis